MYLGPFGKGGKSQLAGRNSHRARLQEAESGDGTYFAAQA